MTWPTSCRRRRTRSRSWRGSWQLCSDKEGAGERGREVRWVQDKVKDLEGQLAALQRQGGGR